MKTEIIDQGKAVKITDPSGSAHRFHAIWLRDNAWDNDTRSPANGQRLIALRDIPVDTRIGKADFQNGALVLSFTPEEKSVSYDINWLMEHSYDHMGMKKNSGWLANSVETWTSREQNAIPYAQWHDIRTNDTALNAWLTGVVKFGFGKLSGGPIEENALFNVVDLFGFVRETNYGKLFQVRTEVNPTNLAFTSAGLQAHTDNPYRDPVPTVQVLYCLESSAAGGENMVVDGFAAALRLREENQAWFDVLSKYCARFEYRGDEGVVLRSKRPMIELSPDGELIGVRFNNRSAAAITDVPFEDMETYYAAYRRLGEIIDDPEMEIVFRLDPGECFVVDNTRVLHARKAYSGAGTRWLQGCYADKDGLYSTQAALQEKVLEAAS